MAKKDAARNGVRVLKRPRPVQRREPLPWNSPKSTEEDPEAHARIEAILNSPSYRRADTDFDFLARDDLRGLRLQIDYLKPDLLLLLKEAGVRQTIVVFGSTRICEHAAASRQVKTLTEALHEQYPNPYITPDLCFSFHYFAMRKFHFVLRAKALVAFPGGYGTFDELFEVLTLVQTQKLKQMPVTLVGKDYWQRAVNFDFLADEGVIAQEDRELFWFAETAEEIWNGIQA